VSIEYAVAALRENAVPGTAKPLRVPEPPGETDAEVPGLLNAYQEEVKKIYSWEIKPKDYPTGRTLLKSPPARQAALAKEILYRQAKSERYTETLNRLDPVRSALLARGLPFTSDEVEWLLAVSLKDVLSQVRGAVIRQARHFVDTGGALTESHRLLLLALRDELGRYGGGDQDSRKHLAVIAELLGDTDHALPDRGEPWADAARDFLDAQSPQSKAAWTEFFAHLQTAEGPAKPSAKWLKEAEKHIQAVGAEAFDEQTARWLAAVVLPSRVLDGIREQQESWTQEDFDPEEFDWQSRPGLSEKNVTLVKGLAWAAATRPTPALARALAKAAEACLRKIPGIGPWAQRAATGAIHALSLMDNCPEAIAQLGRLKSRISHRPVLKQVEQALDAAAKRAGMTREDLEDVAVPTLGFGMDGMRRESFGEYAVTATLTPEGSVTLAWTGPDGKVLKSVPAAVKRDFAEDWKAFKSDTDAAEKLMTAQRHRFEAFYLGERTWKLSDWKTRFREHPLLASFTRRLIWHLADAEGRKGEGMWDDGAGVFYDVSGASLDWVTEDTSVALWHPIGFPVEYVQRWRERLEALGVRQPFKQAHREVYLLTDAELNTGTYSNRFAGHVLKQHQFHALATQRGWAYRLEGGWDGGGSDAARLHLPHWNLRAEFFTEAAGDTLSDSGIFLYLSTDQVRFFRGDSTTPLPLTEVPALAFSEILRDVDLFVGVCSVGNDPNWRDSGPDQFRNYWEDYAFGDLSASAKTRGAVLARLLPRLKIADRCRLDGKFLVVRGDLRTYKIHLGSGNILMEPNDQYLCIVQDRKQDAGGTGGLFLPFEGDQRLALILSKAFLLAEDTKIQDTTITSQIRAH
jgi:hypothetical protein